MSEARKKMLDKVRAMLNANGRTEEEMMAFLAKARELMATYEISESELSASEQEKTTVHKTAVNDPYEIKKNLAVNVSKFTSTKSFYDKNQENGGKISFGGKESNVVFATWLLDTLQRFVMRALREFQKQRSLKGMTNSNYTSASFVMGCTGRINQKLKELLPVDWAKTQELIVKELGLDLVLRRSDAREAHAGSVKAGVAAGNHARFDRPVGADGGVRRLK